ncbi:MAG: hypothetical protein EOO91_10520 [Pedobacter sp.]|nr:MAG: hypothetical protein EOO91_10520 [Pedobacter sp.]
MKRNHYLIILSLLFSLFIYLFYRTEKTVVTKLFISIISQHQFFALKKSITHGLPLHQFIIFSLPEGLWVFSITLASKFKFVSIGKRTINLIFAPLLFSIGLEIFQLFHLTNGRFDFADIGVSVLFWAVANYLISSKNLRQNLFKTFNFDSLVCLFCYLIVYLAHVWQ